MAKRIATKSDIAAKMATLQELESIFNNLQSSAEYWTNDKSDYEQRLADYLAEHEDSADEWTVNNYKGYMESCDAHLAAIDIIRELLGSLI